MPLYWNVSSQSLPTSTQHSEQTLSNGLASGAQYKQMTSTPLSPKNWSRPPLIPTQPPLETSSKGAPPSIEPRHARNPSLSPKDWSRPPLNSTRLSTQGPSSNLNVSYVQPVPESSLRTSARSDTVIPSPEHWSTPSQAPSTSTSAPSRLSPSTSSGKMMWNSQRERDNTVPAVTESHVQTSNRVSAAQIRSGQHQVPGLAIQKNSVRIIRKATGMPDRKINDKPSAIKLRQLKPQPTRKRGRRRDVFIPSSLTVATLASILRMKLGNLIS